jgi:hydroxypyruvate reductase
MAAACAGKLELAAGLVAGPRSGAAGIPPGLEWFDAAHPAPNAASEAAGRRALAMAAECRPERPLLVLLSGGASSMLAVPAGTLTLSDKAAVSRALMNAGAAIAELNCVRKHLSAIKGGRLAAAAAGATITLAISDVHGPVADDPSVIGSGPTVADPSTRAEALAIVRRTDVFGLIPPSVIAHLERGVDETPKPGDAVLSASSYHVIGNRHTAMEGAARAARARGYAVQVVEEATTGEAREAGAAFAARGLREAAGIEAARRPVCVIASGETTVHVRGTGRGGRNQEFAMATIPILGSRAPSEAAVAMASAGTDGIDGPTDAAGAIADSTSNVRARAAGVDWAAALASNAAYDYFAPLGDLLLWGPTGTNVGDLHVMLIG